MAVIVKNREYKSKVDLKTRVDVSERAEVYERPRSSGVVTKDVIEAQGEAKNILEEAKAHAAQIKGEARELLGQVQEEMERSKKQGFEEGKEEGMKEAIRYLTEIHALKEKMFTDLEPQVVQMAFQIAEKIIAQKIQKDEVLLGIVRQAISSAIGNKIIVYIHPQDMEKIKSQEKELVARLESGQSIHFKEDENIKPGGCKVESELGVLDAQLETQLDAIRKIIGL